MHDMKLQTVTLYTTVKDRTEHANDIQATWWWVSVGVWV